MWLIDSTTTTLIRVLFSSIYVLLFLFTLIKILLSTHSTPKTLAYILLVTIVPFIGMFIYFAFGVNYRHKASSRNTKSQHNQISQAFQSLIKDNTLEFQKDNVALLDKYNELIHFIHALGSEYLCLNNYKLLLNGEEKFPEVLKTLSAAEHFIHMEYYDWENDTRGNQIKNILLDKIKKGVNIRIMYDDYASRNIKHNIVKELKDAGAEIYPVIKVKLVAFANRMNHRDHRKVIIVDGHTGFVGGINISDRYDNSIDTGLFWRDTHIKLMGQSVYNLQRHFLVNWNSCQENKLSVNTTLFPPIGNSKETTEQTYSQIVAGGPIYPLSNIMLTYFKIFTLAKNKLFITNPYFISSDSILDALKQAAISGVDVRLMMPEKSDSMVVGAASKFFYREILEAGVKIYLYKKGFVHAKTVVADGSLSVVGTANMDIRSFDLNFEIMSVDYGASLANELETAFLNDMKECREISSEEWNSQSKSKFLLYSIARLVSAFL